MTVLLLLVVLNEAQGFGAEGWILSTRLRRNACISCGSTTAAS